MILYATRPHTVETVPARPGAALRAWRWAIVAERWSLEVEEQVRRGSDAWGPANRYVGLYLSRTPRVGFYHMYHDGPHHSLWLGWINVSWMPDAVCLTCDVIARKGGMYVKPTPEEDTSGELAAFVEAVLAAAMACALTPEELRAARAGTLTELRRPVEQAQWIVPADVVYPDGTGRGWVAQWSTAPITAEEVAREHPDGGFPCPLGAPGDDLAPGLRVASVRVERERGAWVWVVGVERGGAL